VSLEIRWGVPRMYVWSWWGGVRTGGLDSFLRKSMSVEEILILITLI
jgi:hypothetical protein